jgi:nucleotide-binding universal stress UspA family protein
MYHNILVPIDGTEIGELGLREAIGLARGSDSRIRLLHVIDKAPGDAPSSTPGAAGEWTAQMRSNGEMVIHDAKTAVRAAGIEVDDRLIEAIGERVGPFVISAAADWPAQLIVCGTHGRRGLSRMLLGSDAEYIVRHSAVPVLLVRGQPE